MVELVIRLELLELLLEGFALASYPLLVDIELVDLGINLSSQFGHNGLLFSQLKLEPANGLFVDVFLLQSTQVKVVLLVQLALVRQQFLVAAVNLIIQAREVMHELKQDMVRLTDSLGCILFGLAKGLNFHE